MSFLKKILSRITLSIPCIRSLQDHLSKIEQVVEIQRKEIATLQYLLNKSTDIRLCKPAEGDLRKIQENSLRELIVFDNICRQNGLNYWIDFGTLIGAVRHKGFIPWDDDIDVSMPREDFLKVLPLLHRHYHTTDYVIREYCNFEQHFHVMIRDKAFLAGYDIFPVDTFYADKPYTEHQRMDFNNRWRKAHTRYQQICNENKDFGGDINILRSVLRKVQAEVLFGSTTYPERGECSLIFYGIDYPYLCLNLIRNEDVIFPLREVEFEGHLFMCVNKPHEHLKDFFGDYMKYPKTVGLHYHSLHSGVSENSDLDF